MQQLVNHIDKVPSPEECARFFENGMAPATVGAV
jgi:hypothetical protein